MTYFRDLPNLLYPSRLPDKNSSDDYIEVKNIFKRAKIRDDILNAITSFNYYRIEDNERPDHIAKKVYDDPELDWTILVVNNIINLNNEWPLDNESLYNYCIDKYGSEEALNEIYEYETLELRDEYDRLLLATGLVVDDPYSNTFITQQNNLEYDINNFPPSESVVTVNLNQFNDVSGRDSPIRIVVTKIEIETSTLEIGGRDDIIPIPISNSLNPWPSGWGGSAKVYLRDNTEIIIDFLDFVGPAEIPITELLYEIVGEEVNGEIIPKFRFKLTQ